MFLNDSSKRLLARRSASQIASVILILSVALFITSCDSGGDDNAVPTNNSTTTNSTASTQPAETDAAITASPNPVPAGEVKGVTKITWNAGGKADRAEVFISESGRPEVKFAEGLKGAENAPWILQDATYEFRLYGITGTERKLLGKVMVTRAK